MTADSVTAEVDLEYRRTYLRTSQTRGLAIRIVDYSNRLLEEAKLRFMIIPLFCSGVEPLNHRTRVDSTRRRRFTDEVPVTNKVSQACFLNLNSIVCVLHVILPIV